MSKNNLNKSANFFCGIGDDFFRDISVHSKFRDVILPMVEGLAGKYGKIHYG